MSLKSSLQKFLDRVEEKLSSEDQDELLGAEFFELRDLSRALNQADAYAALTGAAEENIKKNRYKDIRPFDYTRVTLCPIPGVPGSDYINANFIQGHHGRASYIAAQGPLPHTVDDFWAMLWQYNTKVVVMACNEREAGKHKCERYWAYSGEEKKFRGITVKLVQEELVCEEFVIRHLVASNGSEERYVDQFHYINWPDHGVPETCIAILEMVAMMRVTQPGDAQPIVVHCSAGCGRTGTICAIDYSWNVLKSGALTEDFSIYNIIAEMRKQRPSSVQTKDQYILVHQAVADLFEQHLEMIKDHLYENCMVEGSGRPVIEESIYESVEGMAESKNDGTEDEIYVNADELPMSKKRSSNHAAEKIIAETLANMLTDEDDATPTKTYHVARSLSKMNMPKPAVVKKTSDEGKVLQGPPALPVKKNTMPDKLPDSRKSDPVPSTKQDELVPAVRKFSMGSVKKGKSMDSNDVSPSLPKKKGREDRKSVKHDSRTDTVQEVGKLSKTKLNFGEQMIKGMTGVSGNGADAHEKHDKPSQSKNGEDSKGNLHLDELKHKFEQSGIVVGAPMPPGGIPRTSFVEKTSKPEKPSHKPPKPGSKPEKPLQKPDTDKHTQMTDSSKLSITKELLQRKKSGSTSMASEYVNVDLNRPEPVARSRRSESDSIVDTKEEKRVPLPLPRGNKPLSKQEDIDPTEDVSSEYAMPYEHVSEIRANLKKPETELDPDDPDSVVRCTKLLPEWLDDEDPYAVLGGKPQISVSESVGADEKGKEDSGDTSCVYAVPHKPPPTQPAVGACATRPSLDSEDGPPVPAKSFGEDRPPVPVKTFDANQLLPEAPDQGRGHENGVKDTRTAAPGKFKFMSFSSFKNKFQPGGAKNSDTSSLAFPNRVDRPKGPRPNPW